MGSSRQPVLNFKSSTKGRYCFAVTLQQLYQLPVARISGPDEYLKGYPIVELDGKEYHLHLLIAAFLPPGICEICGQTLPHPDHSSVHHRDGDRMNSRLENLQRVTRKEHALLHKEKSLRRFGAYNHSERGRSQFLKMKYATRNHPKRTQAASERMKRARVTFDEVQMSHSRRLTWAFKRAVKHFGYGKSRREFLAEYQHLPHEAISRLFRLTRKITRSANVPYFARMSEHRPKPKRFPLPASEEIHSRISETYSVAA